METVGDAYDSLAEAADVVFSEIVDAAGVGSGGEENEGTLGGDSWFETMVVPVIGPVVQPVLDHLGLGPLTRHTVFFFIISLFVLTRIIKTIVKRWTKSKHRYRGPLDSRGRLHGQGEVIYENGDRYEGAFVRGKKHGQGTYVFANGCTLGGDWENGVLRKGTETYPGGSKYTGEFDDKGQRHGRGEMVYAKQGTFKGSFEAGLRHGWGIFRYEDRSRYTGWWQRSMREGLGVERCPGGATASETWGLWERNQLQRVVPEEALPEGPRKLLRQGLYEKISWPELTEQVRAHLRLADEEAGGSGVVKQEQGEEAKL